MTLYDQHRKGQVVQHHKGQLVQHQKANSRLACVTVILCGYHSLRVNSVTLITTL